MIYTNLDERKPPERGWYKVWDENKNDLGRAYWGKKRFVAKKKVKYWSHVKVFYMKKESYEETDFDIVRM